MKRIYFTIDVEHKKQENDYDNLIKVISGIKNKFSDVKIILFAVADVLLKHREVFKQLEKKGCIIGLHGYKHERFDILSYKQKEKIIENCVDIYRDVFGKKSQIFQSTAIFS